MERKGYYMLNKLCTVFVELLFKYGYWTAGLPSSHTCFEDNIPMEREGENAKTTNNL